MICAGRRPSWCCRGLIQSGEECFHLLADSLFQPLSSDTNVSVTRSMWCIKRSDQSDGAGLMITFAAAAVHKCSTWRGEMPEDRVVSRFPAYCRVFKKMSHPWMINGFGITLFFCRQLSSYRDSWLCSLQTFDHSLQCQIISSWWYGERL